MNGQISRELAAPAPSAGLPCGGCGGPRFFFFLLFVLLVGRFEIDCAPPGPGFKRYRAMNGGDPAADVNTAAESGDFRLRRPGDNCVGVRCVAGLAASPRGPITLRNATPTPLSGGSLSGSKCEREVDLVVEAYSRAFQSANDCGSALPGQGRVLARQRP